MPLFHFNVGNSTTGPIGYCARIEADDEEQALARLRELLPTEWEIPHPDLGHDEYITAYFNGDAVKVEDIDEDDDAT